MIATWVQNQWRGIGLNPSGEDLRAGVRETSR
jgi:hypothetical protein